MSNPQQPGRLSSLRVFFLVALLLAVVVGGIVGGIAYTDLGDDDGEHQTPTPGGLTVRTRVPIDTDAGWLRDCRERRGQREQ